MKIAIVSRPLSMSYPRAIRPDQAKRRKRQIALEAKHNAIIQCIEHLNDALASGRRHFSLGSPKHNPLPNEDGPVLNAVVQHFKDAGWTIEFGEYIPATRQFTGQRWMEFSE